MLLSTIGTKTTGLLSQLCRIFPVLSVRNLDNKHSRILFVEDEECDPELKNKPNRRVFKLDHIVQPKVYKPFKTMWANPPCCKQQCDIFRHDVVCLKPSKKKITRTWAECPNVKKEVYVCTGDIEEPEREKRPRRDSKKPCTGNQYKLDLLECKPQARYFPICSKHGRVNMPHCVLARVPPQCKIAVVNKCCQKRCTLYPSYSECQKPKPKVLHPRECPCCRIPANCEVYDMFRKFPLK